MQAEVGRSIVCTMTDEYVCRVLMPDLFVCIKKLDFIHSNCHAAKNKLPCYAVALYDICTQLPALFVTECQVCWRSSWNRVYCCVQCAFKLAIVTVKFVNLTILLQFLN